MHRRLNREYVLAGYRASIQWTSMAVGRYAAAVAVSFMIGNYVPASIAAPSTCQPYKLKSILVNIREDPEEAGRYIDVMERGDIACVTEQKTLGEQHWGYVKHKTTTNGKLAEVGGWANLRYLEAVADVTTKPDETEKKKTAAIPAKPDTAGDSEPTGDEMELLTFTKPIPFGPVPIQGSTIEKLIEGTPMFSPIEGLEKDLWEKKCPTCHKWNRDRLCQQGSGYVKVARYVLRHQHPYGGPFKVALMRWSVAGCK